MQNEIISIAVIVLFVISAIIVFSGSSLVGKLSAVKELHENKVIFSELLVPKKVIKPTETFWTLSIKYFNKECISSKDHHYDTYKEKLDSYFDHIRIAQIIEIVYYREKKIKRIVDELRIYALILMIFASIGFLNYLSLVKFQFSWSSFYHEAGGKPFEIIGLFELIMVVFFVIRLLVELATIRELSEPI